MHEPCTVGTYQDEWRTAVEDPEVRKQLRNLHQCQSRTAAGPAYSIRRRPRANPPERPMQSVTLPAFLSLKLKSIASLKENEDDNFKRNE